MAAKAKKRPIHETPAQGQLGFRFRQRGGWRPGVGRRRKNRRISDQKRPLLAARFPCHIVLRVDKELPNLRRSMGVFHQVFAAHAHKEGFRLVHFSVQQTHVHLVVEAENNAALSRGMQGLNISLARRLNIRWGRRGKVFVDRYFLRILKTPLEVKRALIYVLKNGHKHFTEQGEVVPSRWLDPCSSARYFDGWEGAKVRPPPGDPPPVAPPRTWLLNYGWRRHGLIPIGR